MIGLDTNVLVRAILGDDPGQSPKAQARMSSVAETEGIFISAFAMLELAWVLRSQKIPKGRILATLRTLLDSSGVTVGNRPQVAAALDAFEAGRGDFGDYLLAYDGASHGASGFLSFDSVLKKEGIAQAP